MRPQHGSCSGIRPSFRGATRSEGAEIRKKFNWLTVGAVSLAKGDREPHDDIKAEISAGSPSCPADSRAAIGEPASAGLGRRWQ